MARGPLTFKRRDVISAVKAVLAAGCTVARVEVTKEGRIVVVVGEPEPGRPGERDASAWDDLT